jgi:hypothetical protein
VVEAVATHPVVSPPPLSPPVVLLSVGGASLPGERATRN